MLVDASFRRLIAALAGGSSIPTAQRWGVPACLILCHAVPVSSAIVLSRRRDDASDADWSIHGANLARQWED